MSDDYEKMTLEELQLVAESCGAVRSFGELLRRYRALEAAARPVLEQAHVYSRGLRPINSKRASAERAALCALLDSKTAPVTAEQKCPLCQGTGLSETPQGYLRACSRGCGR